jgi:N-ethylmaleimide reductase
VIRQAFSGALILNSDYDLPHAQLQVEAGLADAIAFGRPFIANPDLPLRLARQLPLAQSEMSTWFTQDNEGYTDYPAWSEV